MCCYHIPSCCMNFIAGSWRSSLLVAVLQKQVDKALGLYAVWQM